MLMLCGLQALGWSSASTSYRHTLTALEPATGYVVRLKPPTKHTTFQALPPLNLKNSATLQPKSAPTL